MITCRWMQPGDAQAVSDLVARAFNTFVAPGYSDEGIQEFLSYAQPNALLARSAESHFVLVALVDNAPAGMIEMRNYAHLSMLFVDEPFHRQGIARLLFQRVLAIGVHHKPDLRVMTVNSSLYAVPVYQQLGFRVMGEPQVKKGLEYVPLEFAIMSHRQRITSGTQWEDIVGYSRAMRTGSVVEVAGTTAVDETGGFVGAGDPAAQTRFILAKIEKALNAAGATVEDVVRTRMFVTDIRDWEAIGRAHGVYFGEVKPAATMVQVSALISPELLVEIEVTAVIPTSPHRP